MAYGCFHIMFERMKFPTRSSGQIVIATHPENIFFLADIYMW